MKFLAFVLPVVLIGFLVFFGVSYKTASDMLDANAETIGIGIGKQAGLDARRVFEKNKANLEDLSREAAILSGDRAAKMAALRDLKAHTDMFANVSYIGLDGIGFDIDNHDFDRNSRDYFKRAV